MFLCFKTYNPAEFWTKKKIPKKIKVPANVMHLKILCM